MCTCMYNCFTFEGIHVHEHILFIFVQQFSAKTQVHVLCEDT